MVVHYKRYVYLTKQPTIQARRGHEHAGHYNDREHNMEAFYCFWQNASTCTALRVCATLNMHAVFVEFENIEYPE